MLPFRNGSPADYSAARALLIDVGYRTDAVCSRTGAERIEEARTLLQGRQTSPNVTDALDVLIRLFFDGLPVPVPAVDTLLAGPGLEALFRLGLVAKHPDEADRYAAAVRLYPTHGLYIASDLEGHAPGLASLDELEPPDYVFSAITTLTGSFLSQLPVSPCERFLELCSGTGIAALAAARTATHAWAVDITERSTRFAAFNARLNGLDNVTALQGDLYEPVHGLTFDRIVAHPPYVPATETRMVYRDGGQDGEEIIRGILGELSTYLAPGGRFYLTCVATDRENDPLEQRVRAMLGSTEGEFDLLLVTHYSLPPAEYYGRLAASGRITYALAEERTSLFREMKADRVVYSSLVLQRHMKPREAFTLRRERQEASASRETEWLLGWRTRIAEDADLLNVLLDSRAKLLPHARLEVTHRVEGGEWKREASNLRLEYPFVRTVEISTNGAMLLTLFDGERTAREILARLQSSGAIPDEASPESFAEFVRELITEGVLGLEEGPGAAPEAGSAVVAPI